MACSPVAAVAGKGIILILSGFEPHRSAVPEGFEKSKLALAVKGSWETGFALNIP